MAVLYFVSTPIGNLGDITYRAHTVLSQCKTFFCEDTRVANKLFKLLSISTQDKTFYSNQEYNEKKQVGYILDLLKSQNDIVIMSDAGTPAISDPGFILLRKIIFDSNLDVNIEILPGASAVITGLLYSGFPTDKFTFLGFMPRKPSDIKKLLKNIKKSNDWLKVTYVAFQSPYRLLPDLKLMRQVLGPKVFVSINRELTKLHQSRQFGLIDVIIDKVQTSKNNTRGEIVLVFRLSRDFLD